MNLCPSGEEVSGIPPHCQIGCLFDPHLHEPIVHLPGTGGGADTSQFSYSHRTGLLYVGVGQVGVAQFRGTNVGIRPPGLARSGRVVAYDPAEVVVR